MKTNARLPKLTKVLSFVVIMSMVLSGLLVLAPIVDETVPIVPETTTLARAGDPLDPGPGTAGQDGVPGDGSDVLLINTYMYYRARVDGYQGGPDSYYISMIQAVNDIHAAGYTVDAHYFSYYTGSYNPGRKVLGYYDKANYYYNYYPVDSKYGFLDSYDDYKAVIIIGYGYYMFGYNYNGNYESQRPVTSERAMTGLEDYAAQGGSIMCSCYYMGYAPLYYQRYLGPSSCWASMRTRLSALFDVTTGTYNRNRNLGTGYYTGYGARGVEGETPNTGQPSIGICHQDYPDYGYSEGDTIAYWYHRQGSVPSYPSIDRYPDQHPGYTTYIDYPYYYYIQNPINDGIVAMEGSGVSYSQIRMDYGWRSLVGRPPNPAIVQSDHGGDFKTVVDFTNPWMGYSTYRTVSGTYKYRTRVGPWATEPLMGSILNFLVADTGPAAAVPNIYPVEIQDTGNKNEWIECANTIKAPVNLY
ncbi:MAG: hypothetical protein KAU14_03755, partial [Thermoplasmata archaeon]|nr:hypothetical protein [Thermoplasmata archaeon]